MEISEKLKIIEDIVPKENARIENTGQSLKITHECGCIMVEHFLHIDYVHCRETINKKFYIKLCTIHNA